MAVSSSYGDILHLAVNPVEWGGRHGALIAMIVIQIFNFDHVRTSGGSFSLERVELYGASGDRSPGGHPGVGYLPGPASPT